jgi:hypothetical protein
MAKIKTEKGHAISLWAVFLSADSGCYQMLLHHHSRRDWVWKCTIRQYLRHKSLLAWPV